MKTLTANPKYDFSSVVPTTHTDDEVVQLMKQLKMSAMRALYLDQKDSSSFNRLTLNDQLYELLSAECIKRQNNGYINRLKKSNRESDANSVQFIEHASHYSLSRQQADYLLSGKWFGEQTLVITGPSGTGKTYCCSSIIEATCRKGKRAMNLRYPLFSLELSEKMNRPIEFMSYINHLCSYNLLVIDDFCINKRPHPNEPEAIKTFLDKCLEKRCGLIISSQVTSSGWISYFGKDAIAEAIVERILIKDKYFTIPLKGESHRAGKAAIIPEASTVGR